MTPSLYLDISCPIFSSWNINLPWASISILSISSSRVLKKTCSKVVQGTLFIHVWHSMPNGDKKFLSKVWEGPCACATVVKRHKSYRPVHATLPMAKSQRHLRGGNGVQWSCLVCPLASVLSRLVHFCIFLFFETKPLRTSYSMGKGKPAHKQYVVTHIFSGI